MESTRGCRLPRPFCVGARGDLHPPVNAVDDRRDAAPGDGSSGYSSVPRRNRLATEK